MRTTAILGLILLTGFFLRSYNLDFPSIGYHNMMENEYLSISQEMLNTQDFINRRVYFYNAFAENPIVKTYSEPPLISYQVIISWKLLGGNLWGPRLINILFGLSSILIIYFIANILFANVGLALYSAFLLAIMPLAVFFSRNLQPESPAFFFMILSNLFYLRFATNFKKYNLFFGSLCMSCAWLYRFNFIFGILPFLFCLPFKALFKEKKEPFKCALAFFLPYLTILAVFVLLSRLGQWDFKKVGGIKLDIFSLTYWRNYGNTILWYIKGENYTPVYSILALLGILFALFKGSSLLNRYIIGWSLTAVFYGIVFSEQIYQQSFAQKPFLVMVCICSAYAIWYISETVKKFFKKNLIIYFMILTTVISIPFVYGSLSKMFATVFFGEDVAGESLKEFTGPSERIFLFTYAQGYAIARYAQRYVGWPANLEEFKDREGKNNIRYVCFYPAEFIHTLKTSNPEWFEYIQNNYHVKEVGLSDEMNKIFYLILERGTGSDPKTFLQSFSGRKQVRTIYKLFGTYIFFSTIRPDTEQKPG